MSSRDRMMVEIQILETAEELVARYAKREKVIAGLLEKGRNLKENLAQIKRMFEKTFGIKFEKPQTEVEENINKKT